MITVKAYGSRRRHCGSSMAAAIMGGPDKPGQDELWVGQLKSRRL